ncbi:MAG: hypothetical protein K2N35_09525 [Muribaculaceae bacterium]|nr:hypothetical protein [Muribaculaceae bacterium]
MEQILPFSEESQYNEILQQAVAVIESSRTKVARAIVGTSNEMHWRIGQLLYERKLDSKHGDGIVKRLSVDLKTMYPKMGMSVSNLWAMKKYYGRFHLSDSKLQRSVGVLPWRHINQLMTKLKDDDDAIQLITEEIRVFNKEMLRSQ